MCVIIPQVLKRRPILVVIILTCYTRMVPLKHVLMYISVSLQEFQCGMGEQCCQRKPQGNMLPVETEVCS